MTEAPSGAVLPAGGAARTFDVRRACVLLAAGLFLAVGLFAFAQPDRAPVATNSWAMDFDINWVAARQLVDGQPIYDRDAARDRGVRELGARMRDTNTGTFWSYIGSPAVALSHVPFLPFGHDTGLHLYRIATLTEMLTAIVLVAQVLPRRSRAPAAMVGLGALFLWFPTVKTIALGQGNGLVMLGLAVALYGAARERWGLTGVGLGVATVLKVTPGLLVVYLLLRGRKQVAAWAVGTVAGWLVLAAIVGRPGDLLVWLRDVTPLVSRGALSGFNQSLPGFLARLASPVTDLTSGRGLGAWYLLGYVIAGGAVLGLWRLRRARPLDVLELGTLVLVCLVAGPLTWDHYVVWAALPLVLLVDADRWRGLGSVRTMVTATAIVAGVWMLHSWDKVPDAATVRDHWTARLGTGHATVALLLLLGASCSLLTRTAQRELVDA